MNASSLAVGQLIELNDGRHARVRFVGNASFQTGDWVGVELEEPTGKNDGSVKGERYFDCEQGYGMFLRPMGVKAVVQQPPKQRNNAGDAGAVAGARLRPSSVHQGPNAVKKADAGAGRRASAIAPSPTPGARGPRSSGIGSPVKSPTKQVGSNGVSSVSSSRTATPPATAARKPGVSAPSAKSRPSVAGGATATGRRTSLMPPSSTTGPSRTSRTSLAPPTTGARGALARTPASGAQAEKAQAHDRAGDRQAAPARLDEVVEDDDSSAQDASSPPRSSSALSPSEVDNAQGDEDDTATINFAPPPPPPIPPDPSPRPTASRRGSSPPASIHSQRTARSTTTSTRHVEELEAKVRVLERKRLEDRDAKRALEQAQQDRDKYQGIIEKLQKKYQPQQQELADLRKSLADAEARSTQVDRFHAEHESIMEMALLDKEMAEETAEALKAELDSLRARQEEMELELEVLRDENDEFSKEMSPEERTSAGWLQMEKENDRLRNALLRLRDLTHDREEELKGDVAELQSQVEGLEKLKHHFDETNEKRLVSEATADDLRQQLEAALGAEEMIEGLTERNMGLQERMDELRGTIDDLENIRELNDELEVNHVEAEKQMQEEIDFKDALIVDRERIAKQQQAALDDADYTINRFRELVTQLQSDLQDMQASKQLSDTEASDLESKSRAMMDLNLRLQSSAAKTQVKTIDLELRRLDAQEASEHLAIVQLFLPEAFHAERDSVLALLRFKRINFKATLLQAFIKERVSSFGVRGEDEDVFAAIDVLNHLVWISGMAQRFVSSICTCSMEDFAKYESALYELEPVERALNGYIDALRRDDVREKDMAEELQRSMAVMLHLAGIHVKDDVGSHADDLIMRTSCLQNQLEGAASALGVVRGMIASKLPTNQAGDDDEESASDTKLILNRADALITHARSAKVMIGKTHRALSELQERSLTLEVSCTESFQRAEHVARQIAEYTRSLGESLQTLFGEEGRIDPFDVAEVASTISRDATSAFGLPEPEAGPFTGLAGSLRTLSGVLANLSALPSDLDNTVEFERAPAPWKSRAEELKQHKLTAQETEAELARAVDSLRERDIQVKSKVTELEEQSVRIEMLEARMREASKRSVRIAELERAVHEAKEGEKRARLEHDRAKREAQGELERVRDELSRVSEREPRAGAGADLDGHAMGAGARLASKTQEHRIASLQAAVRFLKDENERLRLPAADAPQAVAQSLDWLREPLLGPGTERQRRQEALRREGRDVLQRLLGLAASATVVDLEALPENKLAWRPARESSRWQVERRKEEWEAWRDWRDGVVRDVRGTRQRRRQLHTAAAMEDGMKTEGHGGVKIVTPISGDVKLAT